MTQNVQNTKTGKKSHEMLLSDMENVSLQSNEKGNKSQSSQNSTSQSRTLQNGSIEDRDLFDSQILLDVDFTKCSGTYNPPICPASPGENLVLRSLRESDFDKGFVTLLKQLTVVGDISQEQFVEKFESMLALKNTYYIAVIEDTSLNLIIGAATLFIEHKFIHQCALRGRIEDVVVSDDYRGKQLGKLLVDLMTLLSAELGCYKVSLDCKDFMLPFYSRFGFKKEDGVNYMCRRWRIDK